MKPAWTIEEEAERLEKRFVGVKQAQFARDFNVPGGASMLSQHIKGRRPINLDAAKAYARGFNCALSDISPRLAAEVGEAALLTGISPETLKSGQQDWRGYASKRAQEVIEQFTLFAVKKALNDDDWNLLVNMATHLARSAAPAAALPAAKVLPEHQEAIDNMVKQAEARREHEIKQPPSRQQRHRISR